MSSTDRLIIDELREPGMRRFLKFNASVLMGCFATIVIVEVIYWLLILYHWATTSTRNIHAYKAKMDTINKCTWYKRAIQSSMLFIFAGNFVLFSWVTAFY